MGRVAPERLFLVAALIAGLILTFLVSPLAGGNETMNFQRAAMVANGEWRVRPVMLPGGIAELITAAKRQFPEGSQPPYTYPPQALERLRALELGANRPTLVEPNPIAVLNPLAYLPQVPVMAAAQAMGARPLTIFYAGRLAGLIASILLTFLAIRILPIRRTGIAALALLPPMIFARSTLDADQFNTALALLFTALVARECLREGSIRRGAIIALALTAFLFAQAKSAYLLMPLLAFAIPAERFASRRHRAIAIAAIALPGFLASLGWMLMLKADAFTTAQYRTWSGIVEPDKQIALILSHPFDYVLTVLRTVFATPIVPKSLIDFFGAFGPPVLMPLAATVAVSLLFTTVVLEEERAEMTPAVHRRFALLAVTIAILTIGIILTLLYMQWTRVGGPVIDGFNGRYLYPLTPMLLVAWRPPAEAPFGKHAGVLLMVLAFVSVAAVLTTSYGSYVA